MSKSVRKFGTNLQEQSSEAILGSDYYMNGYITQNARNLPHSSIRKMFNLAAGRPNIRSLGIGEPDFDTPEPIIEAAVTALRSGYTKYTANAGDPELRQAISRKLKELNGISVDPAKEVIVTLGAMEALMLAMMVTLDPGDEVILPDPLWPNYASQVKTVGAVPVLVPVSEDDGFVLKADRINEVISPRTKAILINTPCNPTGAVYSRQDLEELAGLARERDLLVYADEVYERLVYDRPHISIAAFPGMFERTITIHSFSKSYAMTGWRVGYASGPAEMIGTMIKYQENVAACAPTMAQRAALAALILPEAEEAVIEMRDAYRARRDLLIDGVNRIPGFRCVAPAGTFYAFANIEGTGLASEQLAMELLDKGGVVVVPGSGFGPGGEGFVRFSFATSSQAITEALERIRKVLEPR